MSKHDCPPPDRSAEIRLTPKQLHRIAFHGCNGTFIAVGSQWVCDCDVCVRMDRPFTSDFRAWVAAREAEAVAALERASRG